MAFAPHTNDQVRSNPHAGLPLILGRFETRDTGLLFEFAENLGGWLSPDEFPHIIYVADGTSRCARVMKTVAYVVVDEAADGSPVTEKWEIKSHTVYS